MDAVIDRYEVAVYADLNRVGMRISPLYGNALDDPREVRGVAVTNLGTFDGAPKESERVLYIQLSHGESPCGFAVVSRWHGVQPVPPVFTPEVA